MFVAKPALNSLRSYHLPSSRATAGNACFAPPKGPGGIADARVGNPTSTELPSSNPITTTEARRFMLLSFSKKIEAALDDGLRPDEREVVGIAEEEVMLREAGGVL